MGQPSNVAPFKKPDKAKAAAKPRARTFLRQYELIEKIQAYQPDMDQKAVDAAYVFAVMKHGQQMRHSGDPYFAHPVAVAGLLTDLKLDTATIIAGLLHDVVEDCNVKIEEVRDLFGKEVADLVDGVTKLPKLRAGEPLPRAQQQAEKFQKFILATTRDVRVLLVKLADRLHNMRTIEFIPTEEQKLRISRETLEIYAPLARRVGLSIFAGELEDLAFRVVNPDAYSAIVKRVEELVQDDTS